MREDQVDRIAQTLENIGYAAQTIASVQTAATMSTASEDELVRIRTRIEVVGRTIGELSRAVEQLRLVNRLEDRHTEELLDAVNELSQLRVREKALRVNIALNEPVTVGAMP